MKERSLNPEDYSGGPTWEDMEHDASRADAEYDRVREDRMLNPHKYQEDAVPLCSHPHDITNPFDRVRFKAFTRELKRSKYG